MACTREQRRRCCWQRRLGNGRGDRLFIRSWLDACERSNGFAGLPQLRFEAVDIDVGLAKRGGRPNQSRECYEVELPAKLEGL